MSTHLHAGDPAAPDLATRRQRAAASLHDPLARTLLVLTFTTGLVDAVCYLGLGHVFAANMTGNVVLLGFGIAGSGDLPVVAPIVSVIAFFVGAGAGGMLAARLTEHHAAHMGRALMGEILLIVVTVVVIVVVDVRPNGVAGDVVIGLLALAMGLRSATVRRIGVPDLNTTVVTMTLAGLAADSRPVGGSGKGTVRRTAAVAAMLTGALAGALLLDVTLALPLIVAVVLTLATAVLYLPAARAMRS